MANRQISERNYSLYLLNIKLRPSADEGRYSDLFQHAFNMRLPICVRGEECMVLKSLTNLVCQLSSGRSVSVLTGKIVRYTRIDNGRDWFDLNTMDKAEEVDLPSNVFPNLKETDYIFIPEAHRLAFVKGSGFSANTVQKFLSSLLFQAKEEGDELEVDVITDVVQVEQILNASEIKRLFVNLSYSNADENEGAAEVLDELMRGSKASTFRNEMTGQIDPNSELVKAFLDLASNNGYAEASIKGVGDTRFKRIKTTDFPKILFFRSEDSTLLRKVVDYVISFWRRSPHE